MGGCIEVQSSRERLVLNYCFFEFRRHRETTKVIAHELVNGGGGWIAAEYLSRFSERNRDSADFLQILDRRDDLIRALCAAQVLQRVREAQPSGFVVRSYEDKSLARMFAVKVVCQADGAVELAVVPNQRSDIAEVPSCID